MGVKVGVGTFSEEQRKTVPVRCPSCGRRLFDLPEGTAGSIGIKCERCKARMVITMKNRRYNCATL